jgi:hypothetical protein
MNCVESILWNQQNAAHPQKTAATEFGAYILLDKGNTTVNVYLQTGPTLSVPGMDWVYPLLDADIKKGYRVLTFLHLHPFDASNTKWVSHPLCYPLSSLHVRQSVSCPHLRKRHNCRSNVCLSVCLSVGRPAGLPACLPACLSAALFPSSTDPPWPLTCATPAAIILPNPTTTHPDTKTARGPASRRVLTSVPLRLTWQSTKQSKRGSPTATHRSDSISRILACSTERHLQRSTAGRTTERCNPDDFLRPVHLHTQHGRLSLSLSLRRGLHS